MIYFLVLAAALLEGSTVQGMVRAEGSLEPIGGATISVPGLRRSVVTDVHGYFVLTGIPEGRWQVEATALGYQTVEIVIVSPGRGAVRLDFELALRPVELPGLEVRATPESTTSFDLPPVELAGPPAVRIRGPTLKQVPGLAEPDVLRALHLLPSVGAISDYSSALYVRGGSADQNLITLDGVPLFNPYHLGGIFSAIGADAVSSVDLAAGAFPASSGDRLSSTVAITTREGGKDRIRASGAVGLISSYATLDGPLPGGRGSFLFSGRRTYIDAITSAAYALKLTSITLPYGFSDGYLKATYPVGGLGSVSVSGYLNREGIRIPERMKKELDGDYEFGWGSKMLALSYRQPIGGSLLLHARAGYTDFRGNFDAWDWSGSYFCDVNGCYKPDHPRDTVQTVQAHTNTRDILAAIDLTWYRRAHTLRTGVQLDSYLFDHALVHIEDVNPDRFPPFTRTRRPRTLAAYLEDEWKAMDRLNLRAGIRFLDAGQQGRAWMPRLGASFRVTPELSLSVGGGRYAQTIRSLRDDESLTSSFIAYDILDTQPEGVGLALGEDIVAGVHWAGDRTSVRLDAYAKWMDGLVVAADWDDLPLDRSPLIVDSFRVASGTTQGLEVLASRRLGRGELSLAYALTFAKRRTGDETFTPRFERRHSLDLTAMLPRGERTLFSIHAMLGTGQPYTPVIGIADRYILDPETGRWQLSAPTAILGDHNSARLPGYFRLDLAARKTYDKDWFGRRTRLTPYFQILNVLNTKNALISEPEMFDTPRLTYLPQFPILPTFGIEWTF